MAIPLCRPQRPSLAPLAQCSSECILFIHIVFCPLPVGLAIVERAVAGHVRSLLLSGKWQDISARGARNLRHAISKTL